MEQPAEYDFFGIQDGRAYPHSTSDEDDFGLHHTNATIAAAPATAMTPPNMMPSPSARPSVSDGDFFGGLRPSQSDKLIAVRAIVPVFHLFRCRTLE